MYRIFIVAVALLSTACVSKSKYDFLLEQYNELCNDRNEIATNRYNDKMSMTRKYNELVEEYNVLLEKYNESKRIIEHAKDMTDKLEGHFSDFIENRWYDADDIRREIKAVESALDGWH